MIAPAQIHLIDCHAPAGATGTLGGSDEEPLGHAVGESVGEADARLVSDSTEVAARDAAGLTIGRDGGAEGEWPAAMQPISTLKHVIWSAANFAIRPIDLPRPLMALIVLPACVRLPVPPPCSMGERRARTDVCAICARISRLAPHDPAIVALGGVGRELF
jgi:hypothetical protein